MAQIHQGQSTGASDTPVLEAYEGVTATAACEIDEQWEKTYRDVCSKIPARDRERLVVSHREGPLTSTQLLEEINPHIRNYTQQGFQRFIGAIDPVLSHIDSFAAIISSFVQTHPAVSGLIWGSLYLVITLAGRAQKTLECIIGFLWNTSPDLALFQQWRRLFPERDFERVSQTIRLVYEEVIYFCVEAIRFLRRKPVTNFFRVIVSPGMEESFRRRETRIKTLTAKVRHEVETAHMHFVQRQLASIDDKVSSLHDTRPLSTDLAKLRIIPHSRNERFFGRSAVLDKMDQTLLPSVSGRSQNLFALYGLGGSGKTQIALHYTYTRSQNYRVIIWILASSTEKIDQGFGQVAERFGMDTQFSKDPARAKDFVLQRLSSSTSSYLLVLDDIDDVSLAAGIIPHGDNGSVITTSRDSIISENLTRNSYEVLEFSVEESCGFLRSSLPDGITQGAEQDIKRVSETFHGYPLALGQIAGFVQTYRCSIHDFLKLYDDKKSSISISKLPVKDYHATLESVWDLSLSSLDGNSRTILEVFALLDPDSLSYDYFTHGITDQHWEWPRLRFMADSLAFLDALKRLRSQSLIRVNSELHTISMHRYFQASIRQQIYGSQDRQQNPFEEAVHLLTIIQPDFMNHSQHWNPQNWAGYQFERNHYKAASDSMAKARRILGTSCDLDVVLLSDCYRVEGRIYNESNQPLKTIESSKKAKHYADEAVAHGLIDLHDSRLPRILTGWGNALNQLGSLPAALQMQLEALRLCRNARNGSSDAITIVQLNWAYVCLRLGDSERAARILRSSLEKDPEAAHVIYPLGNAYLAQGRIDEALAAHLTALDIYVSWFGAQVAVVADSLYKIGEILFLHKSVAEPALEFLGRAYVIYNDQARHYDNRGARARCSGLLGRLLVACGQEEEASNHFERAWRIREELTGVRGTPNDTDIDYNALLFYWSH